MLRPSGFARQDDGLEGEEGEGPVRTLSKAIGPYQQYENAWIFQQMRCSRVCHGNNKVQRNSSISTVHTPLTRHDPTWNSSQRCLLDVYAGTDNRHDSVIFLAWL